jgi:hypothetical protein
MRARVTIIAGLAGALCVSALAIAPAIGAPSDRPFLKRVAAAAPRIGIGTFTPVASAGKNRAVTVAVRARAGGAAAESDRLNPAATASLGIAPVAYNLGAGVGWKRFALSGDVKRIDTGILPGGREGVDLGLSYNAPKWSTRLQVAADRPVGNLPRTIAGNESVSLDVGGAYRLTRNLDVTAGVRYRSERNRLEPVTDNRRDSQAVYVGTAFRF